MSKGSDRRKAKKHATPHARKRYSKWERRILQNWHALLAMGFVGTLAMHLVCRAAGIESIERSIVLLLGWLFGAGVTLLLRVHC